MIEPGRPRQPVSRLGAGLEADECLSHQRTEQCLARAAWALRQSDDLSVKTLLSVAGPRPPRSPGQDGSPRRLDAFLSL
jgi:hypothetical protein